MKLFPIYFIGDYNSYIKDNFMASSYEELKKRYSKEDFLKKAADRRDALNYNKISFGKLSGKKNYIRLLLPQAHECFYLGDYQACIAVCGMMLESLLHMKTKNILDVLKELTFARYKDAPLITIQSEEELERTDFRDLINICFKYKCLKRERLMDLKNIQQIRNRTIHDKMPFFKIDNDEYYLDLGNREIRLNIEEVKLLRSDTASLSSYYVLTRTRMIFHDIVKDIEG